MLIGGSHPSTDPKKPCAGFDAYAATIHAQPQAIFADLKCLLDSAGYEVAEREVGKVRFFACARDLVDEKGHQLLQLKWGGSNPHPHMECNGPQAAVVAAYLREFYSHQVTRIDHAIDLREDGLFDRINRYARRLCKRNRLRLSFAGDWANANEGRTIYIGSRSSQVFVRVYERGIKLSRDIGLPVTDELRDLVRLECEFKPQVPLAKKIAQTMEGEQVWGSADWTRQLAQDIIGWGVERVTVKEHRETNRDRALRFMAKQYGAHLRDLFDKDCECDFGRLGQEIGLRAGWPEADY